ncbi:glutathione S-transferase theta-1-like [Trichogramma pretiosum]|uniref:glutathione S-transferase theta-1-like n=1 Tax=Trichogramma pretiosum TaxID=7493 RepID=UPI0006C9829F|nr:glutathione S-transferase theta-1-like [Trichogramma pretiosum]
MVLKLYFDFLSQPSRALYIFFKKCNIPFESHIVNISRGENRSEEYEEIHPFGKVPSIEHDGFKLIESVGIARYVAREFKVAEHWYPTKSREQAKVDEYLEWQHLNTRVICSRLFLANVLFPMMRQKAAHPERAKECASGVTACLDQFENLWLKDKNFLMGNEISVADLFAACEIEQIRMAGLEPRQGRPKLKGWFDRVEQASGPHYAEAHKYVDDVVKRIAGRPAHTCDINEIFP